MSATWRAITQYDETGESHHYVDTVGGDTIASCFTEQDARLIAASPELLQFAKDVVRYLKAGSISTQSDKLFVIEKAQEIINKVERPSIKADENV